MKTLLDVCKFLKAAGTYYLATVDGDKPRVRPFGTAHIYNGKLYIQTGKKKAVSHQIAANPNVEICAMADGDWLRIEGELVEDDDRMKAMLRSNLYYQIPNSAIYASYHGEIDIRAVYAPDGMTTPYDDMVLLVRGRAPIRCVDTEGNTYVV